MADVVYLIRHAAPPADKLGRYWGASDPGVDVDSLETVRELAGLIRVPPGVLFTSPLSRAMATASRVGDVLGLRLTPLPELAEVDFGVFEGLTFSEVEQCHPEAARQWTRQGDGFAFPRGEAVAAFLARAARGFAVCIGKPEEAVLCATHAGVVAVWCCLFLGLPLEDRFSFRPDYAALTAFIRKKDGSGWEMAFFNNRM